MAPYADGHFLASPAELGVTTAVVVALVVVAFRLPRVRATRPAPFPLYDEEPERRAPGPWAVFATAILAGVAFMLGRDALPAWPGAVLMLVALAAAVGLTLAWSARPGWGRWQRFALACGALLTYSWHAFTTSPVRAAGRPAGARDARRVRARRARHRMVRGPAGPARNRRTAYSLGGAIPLTGFRR